MVSIVNIASAFGQTVPYLAGTRIKPIMILFFCTAATIIAIFTWIAVSNVGGFIVWACYWGFLSGSTQYCTGCKNFRIIFMTWKTDTSTTTNPAAVYSCRNQ
ncbi:hypothetical protein BJX61DRAFT_502907 [Aspergillus egyptiacus]|nr:hypothetical protein BJX61DRAFT_502907 [Aspergillus egyptiacus]